MNDNGLLLCDDLIFSSRITGTAAALGLKLRAVKTPGELLRLAEQSRPNCVIVDLQTPGLAIDEFAGTLFALVPRPRLVGYGSHVDTATLKAAREACYDVVLPRSKFVDELSATLPAWFKPMEDEP